jgi:hypothetical protein
MFRNRTATLKRTSERAQIYLIIIFLILFKLSLLSSAGYNGEN